MIRTAPLEATFAAQSYLLPQKGDLNSLDEGERKRAVGLVLSCISQAKEVGAVRLCVLSGKDVGDADRERAFGILVKSLLEIGKRLREEAGLPLCLKIFDQKIEKKCLIGPAALSARLAKELRRDLPDFGLVHDLSHIPLLFEGFDEALGQIAPYLVQAHMGNSVKKEGHPLYGDQHPPFGVPGGDSGPAELAAYLETLFKIGFLGRGGRPFVGFEVKPPAGVSSALLISNAKRTLAEAWLRIGR
jgi:sugar phosphate isomerase/epimerase